jgi:hypothetical protein
MSKANPKLTEEDWDNLKEFFELLIEADQDQNKADRPLNN